MAHYSSVLGVVFYLYQFRKIHRQVYSLQKALLKQGIFYKNHDELIYFVVCEEYFSFPTYNYRYNLIICQLGLMSNMLKVVLAKMDLSPEFHFYVLA